MVDKDDKSLILNQGEIIALKKAIMYLKFSCEETESLLYASSPLINSIFSKLISIDDLGKQAIDFYNKRHIENEIFILSKLDKMELEMGRSLDKEIKEISFKECLYPFLNK